MCISVVLGRGERSKAKRVSEHLESACAGEGSGGQRWRKPENNGRWKGGSMMLMCKGGKDLTSMENQGIFRGQWSMSGVLSKNQRKVP